MGSNLGDRLDNLRQAVAWIEKEAGLITQKSKIYESVPWGVDGQPDYLNQALEIKTGHSPKELLKILLEIEDKMGRIRGEKWDARNIDLDLLLYGGQVVQETGLIIPHPLLTERNFVLVPLMEIAGEVVHPVLKKPIEDIYFNCADRSDVFMADEQ